MLWIGQIEMNMKQARDFEYFGLLSHEEFQALSSSLSFIWNVRTASITSVAGNVIN